MSFHFEAATSSHILQSDERKEEKLAAAKQRLKQFKKESNKQVKNDDFNYNDNDLSGRSSPGSTHSSLNNNNYKTSNNHSPSKQQPILFNHQPQTNNIADYKDQQLQLHLQTIGILVAEKAELHSKLQQTVKKCDKTQDECDELTGRLKVSRQKINDLEKLVQQLNTTQQANEQQVTANNHHFEIDSNQFLIVDELRMRLNETNDKLIVKQQELYDVSQLNSQLDSKVELLNMKLAQFNLNNVPETNATNESYKADLEESESKVLSLLSKNQTLEATVNDYELKLKQQHDTLKQDYQQYVDQFKNQIEGLVDQINRLTDEREASFAKIDRLELMLNECKKENELLDKQLKEQDNKLKETTSQPQASNKEQLLENEIKYFKQQIEILINEHKNSANLIDEKEHLVNNLNKELKTYEQDREQHSKLLDQVHNDKQTLSRAIQQNKDLKDQLVELQDAFVNVTKQNLDLATKLESEHFKIKQPTETVNESAVDDWDEDNSDNQESTPNHTANKSSLMNGVKERLIELEKENKDLNDYITLMDENLKRNNDQQLSTINSQLKEINSLNETIKEINVELVNLKQQLNSALNNSSNTDNNNNGSNSSLEFNETNFKNLLLLENKFNKVMKENVDLRDKNQDLEHVISQLQFETETIVDYITMYQLEREKLNKKYALKDETIRSLSTQLQVNKLALHELNNYFGAFIRVSTTQTSSTNEEEEDQNKKKTFILIQAQSLLNELTSSTSSTLQRSQTAYTSSSINQQEFSNIDKIKQKQNNQQQQQAIDDINVKAFRSTVSVCPSCHGDLFVV